MNGSLRRRSDPRPATERDHEGRPAGPDAPRPSTVGQSGRCSHGRRVTDSARNRPLSSHGTGEDEGHAVNVLRSCVDRSAAMDSRNWGERYASASLVWTVQPNRFVVEKVGRPASGQGVRRGRRRGRHRGVVGPVVLAHGRDAVRPGGTVLVVGHDLANLCGTGRLQEHPVLPTPQPVVDGSKGRGSAGPEPPPAGNRRCRTVEARRTSRT